ncbi:MAG: Rab family GTPase [Candidatus Heimdallarchaeota archaeon]
MAARKMKLAVLGEGGVGKTTLVKTFKDGAFSPSTMTIAVEYHAKKTAVAGHPVLLQIWDLGGQDQFKNMGLFSRYLEGTQGAVLCFDLTDLDTLDILPEWIAMLPKNISMILVGLKADLLDPTNPFDEAELSSLMDSYPFLEFCLTSAWDPITVNHAFRKIATAAFESSS